MIECKNLGLAKHIGVSNFNTTHIDELIRDTGFAPELNQFEIHPYLSRNNLVKYCHSKHIHVTAYGSLAKSAGPERLSAAGLPALLDHPVVRDIALRRGMTPVQVVLRWTIDRGIAVIPKSVHPSRLRKNLDTLNFQLGDEDIASLNALNAGFRCVTGIHWNQPGSPYSEEWVWEGE
jgi:alcohol dehydrogenase (NADP+)